MTTHDNFHDNFDNDEIDPMCRWMEAYATSMGPFIGWPYPTWSMVAAGRHTPERGTGRPSRVDREARPARPARRRFRLRRRPVIAVAG